MTESSHDRLGFPKLGESNYASWSGDMTSELMRKKVWRWVETNKQSPSDPLDLDDHLDKKGIAAGTIYGGLEDSMKELVREHMKEPFKMWTVLQTHHQQMKPSTRFVAYESLFGIQKRDGESLTALCMRVSSAQRAMKDTRN